LTFNQSVQLNLAWKLLHSALGGVVPLGAIVARTEESPNLTVRFLQRPALLLALMLGLFSSPLAQVARADDVALTLINDAETLSFTLDEIGALPQATVVTDTEFTDGLVEYRGPLVRDVLGLLGMDELDTVRFMAANDYFVDIPTSDFRKYNVILALEADGVALSRRTKGPLWLMYPIADYPELRDRVYNNRLIWQVVKIESL
jgi:hypothetical protein